jgi:hypothetical protein
MGIGFCAFVYCGEPSEIIAALTDRDDSPLQLTAKMYRFN